MKIPYCNHTIKTPKQFQTPRGEAELFFLQHSKVFCCVFFKTHWVASNQLLKTSWRRNSIQSPTPPSGLNSLQTSDQRKGCHNFLTVAPSRQGVIEAFEAGILNYLHHRVRQQGVGHQLQHFLFLCGKITFLLLRAIVQGEGVRSQQLPRNLPQEYVCIIKPCQSRWYFLEKKQVGAEASSVKAQAKESDKRWSVKASKRLFPISTQLHGLQSKHVCRVSDELQVGNTDTNYVEKIPVFIKKAPTGISRVQSTSNVYVWSLTQSEQAVPFPRGSQSRSWYKGKNRTSEGEKLGEVYAIGFRTYLKIW